MLKLAQQTRGPWPVGAAIAGMPHVPCPHNQLWTTTHPLEYVAVFNPRKNCSPPIPAWAWHAPVPREVPDAGAALVPPAALLLAGLGHAMAAWPCHHPPWGAGTGADGRGHGCGVLDPGQGGVNLGEAWYCTQGHDGKQADGKMWLYPVADLVMGLE